MRGCGGGNLRGLDSSWQTGPFSFPFGREKILPQFSDVSEILILSSASSLEDGRICGDENEGIQELVWAEINTQIQLSPHKMEAGYPPHSRSFLHQLALK